MVDSVAEPRTFILHYPSYAYAAHTSQPASQQFSNGYAIQKYTILYLFQAQ